MGLKLIRKEITMGMYLTAATAGTVTEAMTSALSTTASDMMDAVSSIVPVAVPVVGAILVVTLGIKVFKKFTK